MDGNRPRRASLKAKHPNWKEKLSQNCLRRVKKERAQLLWKIRTNGHQTPNEKEIVDSAFRDIVSDELQKIKQSSMNDSQSTELDLIWQYDGPFTAKSTESEELLLEMERLLYEDLREEMIRRELEVFEEEDAYLARAAFEHMQLNDKQVNLDFLRDRLAEVHLEHLDRGCKATPKFSMHTKFGLTALYIQCEVCSTFEIVV
ncbi:uncharacterized protein [Typha angustifolia]|uniref:uncharacterized protein isoform X2 n=1 Tax=Typha angustifolia TaxID=59011 RepID=UPI003C2FAF77